MYPIDDGWRVPDGFPETYAHQQGELQITIIELAVAVRAHLAELRQVPADNAYARECHEVAVSITTEQVRAKLLCLESAHERLALHNRLACRALIRCEAFDKEGGGATQSDEE